MTESSLPLAAYRSLRSATPQAAHTQGSLRDCNDHLPLSDFLTPLEISQKVSLVFKVSDLPPAGPVTGQESDAMLRCTECRPLILDHLFGLLDAPEIKAVAAHLSTCPACAAERTEAAKVHGLIAQAAKMTFPAVRFESPDARTAAKPE